MIEDDDIGLEPWAIGLEQRDLLFVREFLVDLNATQASIRSGYWGQNGGKDPEQSALKNSWRIMRRPAVLRAITAAMEERASSLKISARLILAEAWRCYLASAGDRNWNAATKFLEMAGRHVDVRAFRDKFSPGDSTDDQDEQAAKALENLTDPELDQLEYLTRKAAGLPPAEPRTPPVTH
jgi:hypothetical protein